VGQIIVNASINITILKTKSKYVEYKASKLENPELEISVLSINIAKENMNVRNKITNNNIVKKYFIKLLLS
jgi:hypothetical protein